VRRKLIALAFLLAVVHGPARAEEPQALAAGEILRGSFVQERLLQGFNGALRSEGTFLLAPGKGLIWRTDKPFAITTVMTEKGLAQQSNGATTLNVPASRAPIMAGLFDMLAGALSGDWSALQRDFTVERSEEAGKWHLRLKTRKEEPAAAMPIAEIRVAGGAFVDQVEIEKQGGDLDRLTFADQKREAGALTGDEKALLDIVGKP
jgi:outer membrane lipoprotein-sorting protein